MKLTTLNIKELSGILSVGMVSAKELTLAYLDEIKKADKDLGAFVTLCEESALTEAEAADKMLKSGEEVSPLCGIPMAIKDNIVTKGIKTTCGSKMLESFIPPYNATVAERLYALGAVMLGKTNMDEFGMGSATENSAFHITKNPLSPDHTPGGSSGGSAAAVAAGLCAYALGSDTGGSVRQPAAFCGAVGFKPTYGRISRYGLIEFASSLDTIGIITRDVYSNAAVFDAIAGTDPLDMTCSAQSSEPIADTLREYSAKGLKIGIPREFFDTLPSPDVKNAVLNAAKEFERLGAELCDISLPSLDDALSAYYIISSAEASSNLARYDGIRYGYRSRDAESIEELYKNSRSEAFGSEAKRRIMLGTFALSSGHYDEYYKKATAVRNAVKEDFSKIFEKCDVILSPAAPTTAYKSGSFFASPEEVYAGDVYTVPVNLAGLPAISIPCGKDSADLPIGLQIIGRKWDDAAVYRVAAAYESGKMGNF